MRRPLTLLEAEGRGLLVDSKQGIHTFSNGTHWEGWASSNCLECWFWDPDTMGELCAFEAAAFTSTCSPELARLFGWEQKPEYDKPDDHRHGWQEPAECRFFFQRPDRGDDGEYPPLPPPPDPDQLVLITDPSEDIALVAGPPVLEEVCT